MVKNSGKLVSKLLMALLTSALYLQASEDLNALLNEYAQKADLSNQTKQEAAGTLIVYTRQDLDRMQIKQLKELLAHLPFIHYKENNHGLTDLFYSPYQPSSRPGIRVYINDRALYEPYGGNALQAYAQMDMSYIDHVEIYIGAPALSFGIEQGAIVIKLYTKDPSREEANVVGLYGGSYGTNNLYTYSAHTTSQGLQYLLYADYQDLKRKTYHVHGTELNKDKRIGHFVAQLQKGHHRIEMEAARAKFNQFYGNSFRMDPIHGYPHSFVSEGSLGYYYNNKTTGLNGYVNFTIDQTQYAEKSQSALGILTTPMGPHIYRQLDSRFQNITVDTQLRKKFSWQKWENETGLQARYQGFKFKDLSIDGIDWGTKPDAHEMIYALFNETGYQPNKNNYLLLSLKIAHYEISDHLNDRDQFFGRIGYIYHNEHWTFKNFFNVGDFIPQLRELYVNVHDFGRKTKLPSSRVYAFSTQLIRKDAERKISLFLMASQSEKSLYLHFDPQHPLQYYYDAFDHPFRFYGAWLNYRNQIDAFNTVGGGAWSLYTDNRNTHTHSTDYGGEIFHDFVFEKWTLHNDLLYRKFQSYKTAWNWNVALTWNPIHHWSFFVKGENLLDRGGENRYFSIDPRPLLTGMPMTITRLNHVDPFDRRIWLGLEYQF